MPYGNLKKISILWCYVCFVSWPIIGPQLADTIDDLLRFITTLYGAGFKLIARASHLGWQSSDQYVPSTQDDLLTMPQITLHGDALMSYFQSSSTVRYVLSLPPVFRRTASTTTRCPYGSTGIYLLMIAEECRSRAHNDAEAAAFWHRTMRMERQMTYRRLLKQRWTFVLDWRKLCFLSKQRCHSISDHNVFYDIFGFSEFNRLCSVYSVCGQSRGYFRASVWDVFRDLAFWLLYWLYCFSSGLSVCLSLHIIVWIKITIYLRQQVNDHTTMIDRLVCLSAADIND